MPTQLQYAISGEITPEMKAVANHEKVDEQWLCQEIAQGRIVIPKNTNHHFEPRAIGAGLTTKINANLGTSEKHCNLKEELEKMYIAVKHGADAIMDLSTGGDLKKILQTILKTSPVMVGTVPIYSVATRLLTDEKNVAQLDPEELFREIEFQAEAGVDFMTLHCGVTRSTVSFMQKDERVCGIVSRGGAIIKRWMAENNAENPLYEQYGRILDICEKYDVTISLGDGLRPGAGADATDRGQIAELLVLGELVDRARKRGVQVMVEGPGHMPFDQIETNMRLMKRVCHEAPFYVLGPLTTDIAPGYDHITGAIGGTVAAIHGADFLCYVTPAEHLCLPNAGDVRNGVIASKIAAHSADLVNKIPGVAEKDFSMSKARRDLDWETMYNQALDPEMARKRKKESESHDEDHCSMCGNLCAVKNDKETATINY
ncbi:phosphomethylpyrimidine synthase ThiC [Marinilabilia salmonicolor]|jgi:phosphomethylpyrimidine synthase|uniref:Phosphomethylpyrimidine synthase n=1 Tax=Marinilabilia salmonicolor TaxID=989 RepID=A0A2T0XPU1_9BACT|nr:phosphomethylpyrimidine synthase ThiC [Marinilabilia salmonicolor]PRZ00978.1 phosphomethylpyrimidine synthase [Marinilabilia salmonicolor]RCW31097.1 phosphomethylpyrimidine synthase [Marinilabilia salmonicolor]